MDRTERFYKIDHLFRDRRLVTLSLMMETLGVSKATVKRDLEYLRDRLNAPIVWDRSLRGYRYDQQDDVGGRYVLPGLWFNASEIHALLTMDQLLCDLQPGLLESHIEPLRTRIRLLLDEGDHTHEDVSRRIRIDSQATRHVEPGIFQAVSVALLNRKRLHFDHLNRGSKGATTREVSPQRLLYYRNSWYLDAWCHLRNELRRFGLDAISHLDALDKNAKEVPVNKLNAELSSGYGVFVSGALNTAKLKFSPKIAQWISKEQWHEGQLGQFDKEGNYLLSLPFTNQTELAMDIMRYGSDVEVVTPKSLRIYVKNRLKETLELYK